MTELDFSRCRLTPFQHQREDVAWLMDRPYAFVASEMRTGKSAIIVWTAQLLYEVGLIDKVIVVAPAPVRDVWADETLGEIAKHAWTDVPNKVTEYHARIRTWSNAVSQNYLQWYCTNYEFIRSKVRLLQLLPACGSKTMLVLDESSFIKNYAAAQTKACMTLRRACGRVVALNGTPIFHSPLDLFSQGNILHPSVLDCKYITLFKARYAVQRPVLSHGGKPLTDPYGRHIKEIVGWTNLDDLERRFAPYTVRRLQKECLDLPPKLDPVTLTATLDESWPHYKQMRDELVVWLKSGQVVTSATAAIKALRLSQITGGFLSGVEDANIGENVVEGLLDDFVYSNDPDGESPSGILGATDGNERRRDEDHPANHGPDQVEPEAGATEGSTASIQRHVSGDSRSVNATRSTAIGREKLDVLLWFIGQRLGADPNIKIVAWSRFRAEVFRAVEEVKQKFPRMTTAVILGGQKRGERLYALSLLKPETAPAGPVFVAGIEGTGSFGLDMTASHTCVTMSSGYSPGRSAQTLDRVYGPGQQHPIAYYNIIATGPRGQKTIDHDILVSRMNGENIANRTAAAWVKAVIEE